MVGKFLFRRAIFCAAIMFIADVSGSGTIDVPLTQLEFYKGEEIYLQCSFDDLGEHTVTWLKGSKRIAVGVTILTKDTRISIERPYTRDWNLSITRAKITDRGVYTCKVNTSPPQFGSVQVTVVEDN